LARIARHYGVIAFEPDFKKIFELPVFDDVFRRDGNGNRESARLGKIMVKPRAARVCRIKSSWMNFMISWRCFADIGNARPNPLPPGEEQQSRDG
jgi:hypothetical protein